VVEALSVASDQWFMHVSDPSTSASMVPLFLALVELVPTVVYLRHLRGAQVPGRRQHWNIDPAQRDHMALSRLAPPRDTEGVAHCVRCDTPCADLQ
jgi:hypothetical protein